MEDFFNKIRLTLAVTCVILGSGIKTEAQTIRNDSIKPYISFLENNKFLSAKDYILSKFDTNDIVILSERFHHDMTQYEVIMDVIKDGRFKGHVYTEIGHVNLTEKFNKFLLDPTFTEEAKEKELLAIYRDLCPTLVWDAYNYYYLLSEVWEINKHRKPEDKILIFPTDIPFDYNNIETHREWTIHYDFFNGMFRDQVMGMNFADSYEKIKHEKRKALVILNSLHGYKQYPVYLPLPTRPLVRRAGEFIHKTYSGKTFNIYINSCNIDNYKLSNDGIIDAAFEYAKKNNAGFDLKDTPVGNAKFDLFFTYATGYDLDINYNYIFDGMIFYKPLKDMVVKMGVPDIYPPEYHDLFYKRISLMSGETVEEAKNNEEYTEALKMINTPFEIPVDAYLGAGTVSSWNDQIGKWIE